ncbi:unnamed protein product [Urochloa decumbens]|uniref:CCHC-type domain-containing protein n=1 Tax=Urochloa decumbens TaxID=240449 RepID=A0ABC9F6I4_9POAL
MAGKRGKEREIAVLEDGEGSLPSPRADGRRESKAKEASASQELEEQVSELFGKLNLTAKERDTLILEDTEDSELAVAKHAVIGKVLAPNSLHLQTIMSAMRQAWGNPRGLEARMVPDNMFIAEFESELDKNRVLEGSPWYIGRQAVGRQVVILQEFNSDLRPSDVKFDEMAIWINILNLPFGLRNEKWGFELAGKIGKKVLKIDVDEQKRAVGKELRARVIIPLNEPLPRGVSVFSSRRQRKEWYDVVYEKVPYFCFSCGIIGHSELECPTPVIRDDKGCLPYNEKLRASEDRRLKNQGEWYGQGDSYYRKSFPSGAKGSSDGKRSVSRKSEDNDKIDRKGEGDDDDDDIVVSLAAQNQGRSLNSFVEGNIPPDANETTSSTKKRKSDKSLIKNNFEEQEANNMEVENPSMALVPFTQEGSIVSGRMGDMEVADELQFSYSTFGAANEADFRSNPGSGIANGALQIPPSTGDISHRSGRVC